MVSLDFSSFPEEILERILSHCVLSPSAQAPRPAWHRPSSASSDVAPVRGRVAFLLVSRTFLRICTPLFYNTVHIGSATQLHQLLVNALHPDPSLARYIRRLVISGVWAEAGELLQLCSNNLRTLDVTLDVPQLAFAVQGTFRDLDAEEFCAGLMEVTSLTHIVVRKPGNVYLTQPKPRYVLYGLAKAMRNWDELEHAAISFRLSDDSGTARSNPAAQVQKGPITALTQALSTRRKLHTLATVLPSVWNESILRISANPALERIILADGMGGDREPSSFNHAKKGSQCATRDQYAAPVSAPMHQGPAHEGAHGIHSTGLFFVQAKKHQRLCELIRAGTSIIRSRAQTMGSPVSSTLPSQASSRGHAGFYRPDAYAAGPSASRYAPARNSVIPQPRPGPSSSSRGASSSRQYAAYPIPSRYT